MLADYAVQRLTGVCLLVCVLCLGFAPQSVRAENPTISFHPAGDCHNQLDTFVAAASHRNASNARLETQLAELAADCSHLPQVSHNQGVLAARKQRWPQAIRFFEQSLELDRRAAMTHQHLRSIFEYRAAKAYSRALLTQQPPDQPVFEYQDSSNVNADQEIASVQADGLRSIRTVDYELFALWQAYQLDQDLRAFYTEDFPAPALAHQDYHYLDGDWQEIRRKIAFTAEDAVVVIGTPSQHSALLLMRLVGTRWQIYQANPL